MAGKRKNKADEWMPDRVYRGRTAYEYKPEDNVTIKLGPLTATKQQVKDAYAIEKEKFESSPRGDALNDLFDAFFRSPQFIALSESTKCNYESNAKMLKPVFGHMQPDHVTSTMFQLYMDQRAGASKHGANRERSFLRRVYRWGAARGYCSHVNPAAICEPFKEESDEYYLPHRLYLDFFNATTDMIGVAMDISYTCAARLADVVALRWDEVDEKRGIYIQQSKTKKKQWKRFSPRLQEAINVARQLKDEYEARWAKKGKPRKIETVIFSRFGRPYTADGFKSIWQKSQVEAVKEKKISQRFKFHHLKAKGISDYQGNKLLFSGHKSWAMVDIYDRKTQSVDSLDIDLTEEEEY